MATPTKKRKLTLKQRRWLRYYFETFDATKAARLAGYQCSSDDHFRAIGSQNYAKLSDIIEQWIDEHGLSDAQLKMKLVEGLDAIETKFFSHYDEQKGEFVIEERNVIPYEVRRRYLDMAMKAKDMYAAQKVKAEGTLTVQIVNFAEEDDAKED